MRTICCVLSLEFTMHIYFYRAMDITCYVYTRKELKRLTQ